MEAKELFVENKKGTEVARTTSAPTTKGNAMIRRRIPRKQVDHNQKEVVIRRKRPTVAAILDDSPMLATKHWTPREMTEIFLHTLDPDAVDHGGGFTFQTFDDDAKRKDPALACIMHGTLEECYEKLLELNKRGAGIFNTVNSTDLQGRKNENIIETRAVYQDDDAGFNGTFPLPPQMVVETSPGKRQRYFTTHTKNYMEYTGVQKRLAQDYGHDPNCSGIARVLRMPGFRHMKDRENPHLVKLLAESTLDSPYTFGKIKKAFPPMALEENEKTGLKAKSCKVVPPKKNKHVVFQYAKFYAALHHVDPNPYVTWINVGLALHRASGGSDEGLALWKMWSAGLLGHGPVACYDATDCEYRWYGFSPIMIAGDYIYKLARENEWDGKYRLMGENDRKAIDCERNIAFREFNRHYAVVLTGGKITVVHKAKVPSISSKGVVHRSKLEFTGASAITKWALNVMVPTIKERRNGTLIVEVKPVMPQWESSAMRRQYNGVCFIPKKGLVADDSPYLPEAQGGALNLYQGLAVTPAPGDCGLILAHIREVWCNDDLEQYEYVLNWIAYMYQNPGQQGHTALVLRSSQGTGKGIIVDMLVDTFGIHGLMVDRAEDVTGKFNDHLATSIFVNFNEALWAGDHSAEGPLKRLITDPMLSCEAKYQPKYSTPNCVHLVVSTNKEWAVPVELDDRRFSFLTVSDKRVGDTEYFNALAKQIDAGGKEAFVYEMLNRDLTGFNPRQKLNSNNAAELDSKVRSAGPYASWWQDALDEGGLTAIRNGERDFYPFSETGPVKIVKDVVMQTYQNWCSRNRIRNPDITSKKGMITKMERFGLRNVHQQAGTQPEYEFPSLSELKALFDKVFKQ